MIWMETSDLHKIENTGLDHIIIYYCITHYPNLVASSLKHGFCGSQIQFGLVDLYKIAVKNDSNFECLAGSWGICFHNVALHMVGTLRLSPPPWVSLLGSWCVLLAGQLVSFDSSNPKENMAEAPPSFMAYLRSHVSFLPQCLLILQLSSAQWGMEPHRGMSTRGSGPLEAILESGYHTTWIPTFLNRISKMGNVRLDSNYLKQFHLGDGTW